MNYKNCHTCGIPLLDVGWTFKTPCPKCNWEFITYEKDDDVEWLDFKKTRTEHEKCI